MSNPQRAWVRDWALHYHRCGKCGGFVPCQMAEPENCAVVQAELSKTCGHPVLTPDERHHGSPPAVREFIIHLPKSRVMGGVYSQMHRKATYLDKGMCKAEHSIKTRQDLPARSPEERRDHLSTGGIPALTDPLEEVLLRIVAPHEHHWTLNDSDETFDWESDLHPVVCACGATAKYEERTRRIIDPAHESQQRFLAEREEAKKMIALLRSKFRL